MHAFIARSKPIVRAPIALLGALVLGACVGNVARPVPESARDTEGRHDGLWVAKVDAPGGRQTIEQWHFDCRPLSFEWTFEVRDGVVRIDVSDGDGEGAVRHEAFVDADGRFRLEMPLEHSVRASAGSDQPISDGAVTLILEGELGGENPRGHYVAGVRQFLDRGCRHRVDYDRRDA